MSILQDLRNYRQDLSRKERVKGIPVLGILPEIRKDTADFLVKVLHKQGSMAIMRLGPQRVIMAGHPEAVKYVSVTNAKNYHKEKYVNKLIPLLGDSVLTSNGLAWETPRQVLQERMTMGQVQGAVGLMDEIITRDLKRWSGNMDTAEASTCTTLRVISATMLGGAEDSEIERIIAAMHIFQSYFSDICWTVLNHHKIFRTKLFRRFLAARTELYALVDTIIDRRQAAGESKDLLHGLVNAVDVSTGAQMSNRRIREEIIGALIAGHETTGQTLAFAWHALASDPDLQEKLREEAFRCLPLDQPPTAANLRNMELTAAFLKEIERLYPAVWWVARTALGDDEVMGIPVSRGDVLMLTPYITHRIPEFWDDAESFKADRFVEEHPSHKFAFVPFGVGPRICPGLHLASIEMKIAVGRLLQRAELTDAKPMELEGLITMRPKGGMPLSINKITRFVKKSGVLPGENAFVDSLLRTRKKVFVDMLDWPLVVDDAGREIDQFDNKYAEHCALISDGELKAYGRLLPTARQSLLYDVYGWLVDHPELLARGETVWEGTRMGTAPSVPAKHSAFWLRELIMEAARTKAAEGVRYFCSVSDPTLERVLRRTGIPLQRLGDIKIDKAGIPLLALRLDCNMEQGIDELLAPDMLQERVTA